VTRRSAVVAVAVLAVVAGLVAVYAIGGELSRPVPARIGPAPPELHAEAIAFRSASGSTIRGWLSRGTPHRGAVLLLPGVRANRLAMNERARMLSSAGYSTLSIDFQATGESPGDAITFGWRERFDVIGAVEAIRRTLPGEPIGVIGTSLGGAATTLAAADLKIQSAVLEAVYPSIDVAVENRMRMRLGAVGAAMSPLLLAQLQPRLGVSRADLRPVEHIGFLHCPVLVIVGGVDQHTTVNDTQLYAAAHAPKELWLLPNVAHVDFLRAAGDEYRRRILAWFDETLRIRQPANMPLQPTSGAAGPGQIAATESAARS
jgi:uncharacterized protein